MSSDMAAWTEFKAWAILTFMIGLGVVSGAVALVGIVKDKIKRRKSQAAAQQPTGPDCHYRCSDGCMFPRCSW